MQLFVALTAGLENDATVQVCDTRESALAWLAAKIPTTEWESFYDRLEADDRAALDRDPTKMTPADLLTAWVGEPDEHGNWSADMETYEIHEQTIWKAAA
ncbi:hypothetical protein [Frigoribacterium sp. SL97]|uniref:hypothetical protein n=1 Tax=Frigoribacterium sp. SL97 TaxID=2994664 RepID=UPI002271BF6F|nr:hypothetical protein [Frigoribacterium sp. SL97]WAC50329.1 hypothetical protein OVA02_10540 [Frigoribacterium sp. SL97]